MISRQEFERERARRFVFDLFWALDSWVDSFKTEIEYLKRERGSTESPPNRQELETMFRHGFLMRTSQLSLRIDEAYQRLYASLKPIEQKECREIHLNDLIEQIVHRYGSFLEKMGSSAVVAKSPRAVVQFEGHDPPLNYVMWWILDGWPDSQVAVDFAVDQEKVRIIFQDTDHVYTPREHQGHRNLPLWMCIIEYQIIVECHGWCIWPRPGGARRLEIILPLRPPTPEELAAPLPEWMK